MARAKENDHSSGAKAAIKPKTTCITREMKKMSFLPNLKNKIVIMFAGFLCEAYLSDNCPKIIEPNITPTIKIALLVAIV